MVLIKAFLSAQLATLVDFSLTLVLASWLGVYYVLATFLGSVAGGVLNCCINYQWVFPGSGVRRRYIALKYLFVWTTSILLNTYGTYVCTEWLSASPFVQGVLGEFVTHVYVIGKVIVALAVAICWNYTMQRYFVFSNLHLIGKKIN